VKAQLQIVDFKLKHLLLGIAITLGLMLAGSIILTIVQVQIGGMVLSSVLGSMIESLEGYSEALEFLDKY